MKRLSEKIKKLRQTPYQRVAAKFSTSESYVSQIATGFRAPKRGKGLKIKKELEKLTQKNTRNEKTDSKNLLLPHD